MRPTITVLPITLAALLAACATPAPMTAPAPTQLASSLTPAAVVQRAVATLAAQGFTVTTSDATNGIMVARMTIDRRTARDWLACPWKSGAIGWQMTTGTFAVTVTATPRESGSAVSIVGTPQTSSPECVSGGQAEAAVARAITAP